MDKQKYTVTHAGRIGDSWQTPGATVHLTPEQAKYLIGVSIEVPAPAAKPKPAKKD